MSKIAEIYRNIEASGRDEVFIHLRPQADVDNDYRTALAADGPLTGLVLAVKDNVDVAGIPTLTLPTGLSPEGAPLGFQLVAPELGESALLSAGAAYERRAGTAGLRPAL